MESTGEMDTALQFYEAAQDFLSLVRVYCYCGNLERVSGFHKWEKVICLCKNICALFSNNGRYIILVHNYIAHI